MVLLLLLFCYFLPASVVRSSTTDRPPSPAGAQLEALIAFRDSITHDSSSGALASWTPAAHHCSWAGVACDLSNTSVLSISLPKKKLSGVISPFLGNISTLRALNLNFNFFYGTLPATLARCSGLRVISLRHNLLSGEIPSELGNLRKLRVLKLRENHLQGSIPSNICNCTSLVILDLRSNNLTGKIPEDIGNLINLQSLVAGSNGLVGSIPSSFWRLTGILLVGLYENQLSGTISPEIGNFSSLIGFVLYNNRLVGVIPPDFGRCGNLRVLVLYKNDLTGSIPPELGQLRNLKTLTLAENRLSSTIPNSLSNCTSLTSLQLNENALTGKIPMGLGNLQSLRRFTTFSNLLVGDIPADLFNCTTLTVLHLANNSLTGGLLAEVGRLGILESLALAANSFSGPVPAEIGNLTMLMELQLQKNKFNLIPPEISKLTGLQFLSLEQNALGGVIPEEIFELRQLVHLSLHKNKLTGPIPDTISRLEMLSHLYLQSNQLSGWIPESMQALKRLLTLDLSFNNLTGSIPGPVVAGMRNLQLLLNMSNNRFQGSLPGELGKLDMIERIDLSNNMLSGSVPETLGGSRNLRFLDLSGNMLSGKLPTNMFVHFGLLTDLKMSRNKFVGELPADIAQVKQLTSLDLSQNEFEGFIPMSLMNLTNLTYLNLSFNHFQGPIPQGGIFRKLNFSSLQGNPGLCGAEIHVQCPSKGSHGLSKKRLLLVVLSSSFGLITFLVILFTIFMKREQWKRKEANTDKTMGVDQLASAQGLKRFTREELEIATEFFSEENLIGSTSLSTVFKGRLQDTEKFIAVKKLNLQQFPSESDKCFFKELKTLGCLKHRNLVKVVGYAWESGKLKAVVLEYMENGSLEDAIHEAGPDSSRWEKISERLRLLISVVSGIVYLHSDYDFPIVHCDLKPSNILLDQDWEAHVSDFGAARMLGIHLPNDKSLSASSTCNGTIGYIAPEFAYLRKVTTKVDVFSFGIIIMELLTGRRPTSMVEEDGCLTSLPEFVANALAGGIAEVLRVLDQNMSLTNVSEMQMAIKLLETARCCTQVDVRARPDAKDVMGSLLKLRDEYQL